MPVLTKSPRKLGKEKGGKFRVIVGIHFDFGPPGCTCDRCLKSKGRNHLYSEGDVFESKVDIERRFNMGPHSRKFERVSDDTMLTPPVTDADTDEVLLDAMTLAELKQFAQENGVELGGESRKSEVLKIIKTALEG